MPARFLVGSQTMPGQLHSQPTPTSLVKGVCVFRCNLPHVLLAQWLGSFTCHCSNTGVERIPNKSQHTKLTLQKKILPPFLPGLKLATFQPQVWHSTNKLSRHHSRSTLKTLLPQGTLCHRTWAAMLLPLPLPYMGEVIQITHNKLIQCIIFLSRMVKVTPITPHPSPLSPEHCV